MTLARLFACALALWALAPIDASADRRPKCASHLPADANEAAVRIACEIPDKFQRDVTMAEIFGAALRRHDIAAWLTTDELLKIGAFDRIPGEGTGWITTERDDSMFVRYFHRIDGRYGVVAEATLRYEPWGVTDARSLLDTPIEQREADEDTLALLRARELAMRQNLLNCNPSRPFNTAILRLREDGQDSILVFLMSGWDDHVVPLGGFHMLRISEDGTRTIDTYSQTPGCRNLTPADLDAAREIAIAHDASAVPTPLHVFLALQYRKPLYVKTTQNALVWKIDGTTVSLLDASDRDARRLRDAFIAADRPLTDAPDDSNHTPDNR